MMPRNRILALVVTGLMLAMLGVLVFKAFDIHDTQPLGVDPEFPLFVLGSMLLLCLGTVALTVNHLGISLFLSLSQLLPVGLFGLSLKASELREAFEIERLLFSPPLAVVSLRI